MLVRKKKKGAKGLYTAENQKMLDSKSTLSSVKAKRLREGNNTLRCDVCV